MYFRETFVWRFLYKTKLLLKLKKDNDPTQVYELLYKEGFPWPSKRQLNEYFTSTGSGNSPTRLGRDDFGIRTNIKVGRVSLPFKTPVSEVSKITVHCIRETMFLVPTRVSHWIYFEDVSITCHSMRIMER